MFFIGTVREAGREYFAGDTVAVFAQGLLQFVAGAGPADGDAITDVEAGVFARVLQDRDKFAGQAFAFEFRGEGGIEDHGNKAISRDDHAVFRFALEQHVVQGQLLIGNDYAAALL